jgi:hypothetical protein
MLLFPSKCLGKPTWTPEPFRRKRVHNADDIVAKRLVDHPERAGSVAMKPPTDRRGGLPFLAGMRADMGLLGRLIEWLGRRKPTSDDGARPIRKSSDQGDRQPDVDQIEELRRLIGEADGDAPRSRTKPTNARRARSRGR